MNGFRTQRTPAWYNCWMTKKYSSDMIQSIRIKRAQGKTYQEINAELGTNVPKSSLSYICKGVDPGEDYKKRMLLEAKIRMGEIRKSAVQKNRKLFNQRIDQHRELALFLAPLINNIEIARLCLAMLYLGEGAKWRSRRGPLLSSSDPRIIRIYLALIRNCYNVDEERIRCRIQHRADQSSKELVHYWSDITGFSIDRFYPCYVDKRTIGKTTKRLNYRGVCSIMCPGTDIQLELDLIADMIDQELGGISSAG